MPDRPVDRFVRRLVRIAGRDKVSPGPWERARYPLRQPFCLTVDGWMSQSGIHHISELYRQRFQTYEIRRNPQLHGFSYADPIDAEEQTYTWEDTFRGVDVLAEHFAAVLRSRQPPGHVVVVAYSLGGAVALVGLSRVLDEDANALRARVPLVVLIQPAIFGSPELAAYLPSEESPFPLDLTIGSALLDLGSPRGVYPLMAQRAIPRLLDLGIGVNVVFCEGDAVAPYVPFGERDQRVWENLISASNLGRASDEYDRHIRLRSCEATVDFVYHLTRPHIAWQAWPDRG